MATTVSSDRRACTRCGFHSMTYFERVELALGGGEQAVLCMVCTRVVLASLVSELPTDRVELLRSQCLV